MRKLLSIVIAATALMGTHASAHPGTNITHGSAAGTFPTLGSGVIVAGYCRADAKPASNYTALATTVRCTVNGTWYRSETVTAAGPLALTPTATVAVAPLTICVESQAVFATPLGATVTSPWVTDCFNIA